MSPLEAAATRAIPTTMVHHGGRAQAGVPGLCTPSEPPLPLPQSFPASLSPGTSASRLEMSWGKGGGAGQRDSRVFSLSSRLKNVCKPSASTLCVDERAVLILPGVSLKMWQELRKTASLGYPTILSQSNYVRGESNCS